MRKLKHRFDDFYGEYGCYLWTIVTIQALSLIITTTTQAILFYNEAVYDYFNEFYGVTYVIFWLIYKIDTFIVPMMTQLSCLIFGWIRYRRGEN